MKIFFKTKKNYFTFSMFALPELWRMLQNKVCRNDVKSYGITYQIRLAT